MKTSILTTCLIFASLIAMSMAAEGTNKANKQTKTKKKKVTKESLHIHEHKDFDSYQDFLHEYYNNGTDHIEVQFIKKYFPAIETQLNPADYAIFLQNYLEENLNNLEGHEEVIKEHSGHNEVLPKAYLQEREEEHGPTDHFELKDAYMDLLEGDFMFYLDTVEVKTPSEIEEEEKTHQEMNEQIKKELEDEKKIDQDAEKLAAQETTEELDL